MKSFFCVLFFFCCCSLLAAPGDTAVTYSHQSVIIKTDPSVGATRYPGWASFPSTQTNYHKVLLSLKFECADGLSCGEWDYTNHIVIGKVGGINGDSLGWEFARFITPYGHYWYAANKWNFTWYYDVTDFAYLLHDSVQIVYEHSGYEPNNDRGWKITLKFMAIEGTPVREPVKIDRVYHTGLPYGYPITQPLKKYLPDTPFTVAPAASWVRFKLMQTGHGNDNQDHCGEFCKKDRFVVLDGDTISQKPIWRDDCGMNPLYPQFGTWIYDRANWCPGAPVYYDNSDMNLVGGSNHKLALEMEYYKNDSGGGANYDISAYNIHYKDFSFSNDVAIDDILSPSDRIDFNRYNPVCQWPLIRITNTGKGIVNSIRFKYYMKGGTPAEYLWNGNLKPLQQTEIYLANNVNWDGTSKQFFVEVKEVNGKTDDYSFNNIASSYFKNTPLLHDKIYVRFNTNRAASENYYYIIDAMGDTVFTRNQFSNLTLYKDTVQLKPGHCYRFDFYDDGEPPANFPLNKDGLGFWANTYDTVGELALWSATTNKRFKNFAADFGTKISYQFTVGWGMGIEEENTTPSSFQIFPNPAKEYFVIESDDIETTSQIYIYDTQGKVCSTRSHLFKTVINTEGWHQGLYMVKMLGKGFELTKKIMVE